MGCMDSLMLHRRDGAWCRSGQVLAAAGAVDHDELVKRASDAFGAVPDEDPTTSVRSLLAKVSWA
jgi:hypothetical protein